jgi:hypothetical protein
MATKKTDYITVDQARAMFQQALQDAAAGKDPGTITFRLKPSKKANEPYFIKMTETQRQSLLQCTELRKAIRQRIEDTPAGTQTLGFTRKELYELSDEIGQAAYYAKSPHKKRLMAIRDKIDAHFTAELAPVFDPSFKPKATSSTITVYQFKITLLDIKPVIWRRIQMTEGTLADLHECIQGAFGWSDYHLHQFKVDSERFGPTPPPGYEPIEGTSPEEQVRLRDIVPRNGQLKRWLYEYDFGDGWRHEVLFEGHPKPEKKRAYPWCLEGERACPPEDCGGPFMYPEYLEAITDPSHERHEELLSWRGPFDPESFDAKKATRVMRRRL